jgi:Outer membrane protein beta-barrel domain
MKNLFLLFIIGLALHVGAQAQEASLTKPRWLVKAGGVSANQTATFFDSPTSGGSTIFFPKWGLHVGVFREWPVAKHLSLVAGLSYRQRGARQTSERFALLTGTETTTLHYLSGDMLFKYTIPLGKFSPYLLGGARLDHFLTRTGTQYFNDLYANQQHRQLDGGPVVGLGVQVPLGQHYIGLEAEYNPGVGAVVNRSLFGAQFFNRARGITLVWGF